MTDIPIAKAVILFDAAFNEGTPAFAIRHLGHDDYRRYQYRLGACFSQWRESNTQDQKMQLMIDIWHATAFYGVPPEMMTDELLRIPEYRDMLAQDCLPDMYRNNQHRQ